AAIELAEPSDHPNRVFHAVDDEAGHAVLQNLRHRPAPERDHRRTAGHRLDHHQPERLGPIDGKEEGVGAAEKGFLLPVVHLGDKLYLMAIDVRFDSFLVIASLGTRDLGGDAERSSARAGDLDRRLRTLFRGDATEKGEIAPGIKIRSYRLWWQAMVDRGHPIGF